MPVRLPIRRRVPVLAVAAAVALLPVAAACGDDESSGDGPAIVVTTPMLGTVVQEVVGDAAQVEVVMPNGVDPHDFEPSARDAATLSDADLMVENGLDLEEGMLGAIDQARDAGVPVFTATDHVEVREGGEHDHEGEEEHAEGEEEHAEGEEEHAEGEEEHEHGAEDPHIWMDPLAMADVAAALAPAISDQLGLDLGERPEAVQAELAALDEEVRSELAGIPAARRLLVTGHDSMGYFADRYDFEVIGALVPSLSTQAQASASDLADLRRQVEETGVPAIFTEVGTPGELADAIADETGARVVEIDTTTLPDDGTYATFMSEVAARVDEGLGG